MQLKDRGRYRVGTFGLAALTLVSAGTLSFAIEEPKKPEEETVVAKKQERSRRRVTKVKVLSKQTKIEQERTATPSEQVKVEGDKTVLPEVVVTSSHDRANAYAVSDLSIGKYKKSVTDTPQAVNVISKQLIQDQHVTTLRDAVRNVAGISIAAGEGGNQGDSLTLRGFTARNDIFLDGMRDFGSYYRDSFNWEQVEVLKGPASVNFGRGSTGGVVNQVSKVPQKKSATTIDLSLGTANKERITIDSNQPLSDTSAFRLNAMQEETGVANRQITQSKRWGVAPSLALGLGTSTRFTLSYLHQEENSIPDYGVPWVFNAPSSANPSLFYGFSSDYLLTEANVTTLKVEHDFSDTVMVKDQIRYASYNRAMRATEAKVSGTPTLATPLDSIALTRNEINTNSNETFLQNQLELSTVLKTGDIKHDITVGTEIGRETSSPTRYTITNVPNTTLTSPNPNQAYAGTNTLPTVTRAVSNSYSVYGLDSMALNEQWNLSLGTRWDRFSTIYEQDAASPIRASQVDNVTSWRGSLSYKPVEEGSVYASYGTSFNPSAEALSLSASSASLAPEQNVTYEVGTKWDVFEKRTALRAAIFRTEKNNARETVSGVTYASGNQRIDGLELEVAGKLTPQWQVSAGYAYLDSILLSSSSSAISVGGPLANVPKHNVTVWTTYDFPGKIQVGGGMNYLSSRRASISSAANAYDSVTGLFKEVPSYCVFNAMVSVPIHAQATLQLNIYNVFNTGYFDQVHPGHVVPGEGRAFVVSTSVRL